MGLQEPVCKINNNETIKVDDKKGERRNKKEEGRQKEREREEYFCAIS